jgi:hypothetical protein
MSDGHDRGEWSFRVELRSGGDGSKLLTLWADTFAPSGERLSRGFPITLAQLESLLDQARAL